MKILKRIIKSLGSVASREAEQEDDFSCVKNPVVRKNLERMTGERYNDMPAVLVAESMGGNAGYEGDCVCAAVNFYYVRETGEIMHFGNEPKIPEECRQSRPNREFGWGTFRVAYNFNPEKDLPRSRIVNTYTYLGEGQAKQNLEESAEEWNKLKKRRIIKSCR